MTPLLILCCSVSRPQHENGGIRTKAEKSCASGHKQPVQIGHEQRCARASGGFEEIQAAIIGPVLLPCIHVPVAAAHINTTAFRIEEDVIRISAGFQNADRLAGVDIEDDEPGRVAENHCDRGLCSIERHRKICAQIR